MKLNINLSVSLTINCRNGFVSPIFSDTGVAKNSFAFIVAPFPISIVLSNFFDPPDTFIGR